MKSGNIAVLASMVIDWFATFPVELFSRFDTSRSEYRRGEQSTGGRLDEEERLGIAAAGATDSHAEEIPGDRHAAGAGIRRDQPDGQRAGQPCAGIAIGAPEID